LIPFRLQPPAPRLRAGYQLLENPAAMEPAALNRLLLQCGDRGRSEAIWQQVLARSTWCFAVLKEPALLVGFVRVTSDMALNANLWDLVADAEDHAEAEIYQVLVEAALTKLRRELSGCSISLSAPPAALQALERHGFVIDPGGIRAMGLTLE